MQYRFLLWILVSGFWNSSLSAQEIDAKGIEQVKSSIELLDHSLLTQDSVALDNLLSSQLSIGHSNGWVQSKSEVLEDFKNGKLSYTKIEQLSIEEISSCKIGVRVRRTINVTGKYKTYDFDMKLSVLEIWILEKGNWQLWTRQSVKVE